VILCKGHLHGLYPERLDVLSSSDKRK
jgi:hypothetical protein